VLPLRGLMVTLLFVDDDRLVLQAIQDVMGQLRPEWRVECASSGREALARLERGPVDVVVSDLRMPGMDGTTLLGTVMERYPDTIRIIQSGYVEQDVIMRGIGVVHQYLAKPWDVETLITIVGRAVSLRTLLTDHQLRSLLSSLRALPTAPTLCTRLISACQSPGSSLRTVADIVAEDAAMTTKILHLANSPFFGRPRQVSDPMQAVQLLGIDMVKALVLAAHVFGEFPPSAQLDAAWRHSLITNAFSRIIATAAGSDPGAIEEAAVAGLLHDVGQLVLAANRPADSQTVARLMKEEALSASAAEERVFGATHMAVGAYVLGLWGLPDAVVEATRFHHVPGEVPHRRFAAVSAVHIANAFANVASNPASVVTDAVDLVYLRELGVDTRLPEWHDACRAFTEPTLRDDPSGHRAWSVRPTPTIPA
jgi:HD-like signal output (HDOD) protein/CheY-like chemotaxis protein